MNANRDSMGCSWADIHGPAADELTHEQRAEIDVRASEELYFDVYVELFAVLADASDSGLVKRQAEGDPMCELSPGQLDVFARYARLADRMAAVRAKARAAA